MDYVDVSNKTGPLFRRDEVWKEITGHKLHPDIIEALKELDEGRAGFVRYDILAEGFRSRYGDYIRINEGWRTPERQEAIYNSQLDARYGAAATNARAYQSYHNWGLAVDLVFTAWGFDVAEFGKYKINLNSKDGWLQTGLPQFMKSKGFGWGGDWTGRVQNDFTHFELAYKVPASNDLAIPGWWDMEPATVNLKEKPLSNKAMAALGIVIAGGIAFVIANEKKGGRK